MNAATWYWLILVVWILFGVIEWFNDDPRIRQGGNLALIVLFVLIGFMAAGSPIK